MGRHEDRHAQVGVRALQRLHERVQTLEVIDVLLAMRADEQERPGCQPHPPCRVGALDRVTVMIDDLAHRRSGEADLAGLKPLPQEVPAGMFGVDEIEVGDVVDEPPVRLLGHVEIEAAVAGLHVEHRHAHAPGHDRGQAAVRVSEDEDGVRTHLTEHPLGPDERPAEDGAERRGVDPEVVVRGPQLQLVEEDLVELVVVVLAGVDQHVLEPRRRDGR